MGETEQIPVTPAALPENPPTLPPIEPTEPIDPLLAIDKLILPRNIKPRPRRSNSDESGGELEFYDALEVFDTPSLRTPPGITDAGSALGLGELKSYDTLRVRGAPRIRTPTVITGAGPTHSSPNLGQLEFIPPSIVAEIGNLEIPMPGDQIDLNTNNISPSPPSAPINRENPLYWTSRRRNRLRGYTDDTNRIFQSRLGSRGTGSSPIRP